MKAKNLTQLRDAVIAHGGVTYSLFYGDMQGTKNYAVALHGYDQIYSESILKDQDKFNFAVKQMAQRVVADYDYAIGVWHEKESGTITFDVVRVMPKEKFNRTQAVKYGTDQQQKAIYDLEESKVLYTYIDL